MFSSSRCMVIKYKWDQTIVTRYRSGNTYIVNPNNIPLNDVYLLNNDDESWLWHRRITHIQGDHLNKSVHKDLVIGLPNMHLRKVSYVMRAKIGNK